MTTSLPVIVGFGGFNAAGRSSFHHAYRRMVIENLPQQAREETLVGLATMMKLVHFKEGKYIDDESNSYNTAEVAEQFSEQVLAGTLIRKIETSYFDVDATHNHQAASATASDNTPISFTVKARQLPTPLPSSWQLEELDNGQVKVTISDSLDFKVDSFRDFPVKAAGQLPSGFDPGELYNSRFHPRGLKMTIAGASDAIQSMGIEWQTVADAVGPDEISVYASSGLSQLDKDGFGGVLQSRLHGNRVTAKQLPLGLNTMVADFINAYLLGSVGQTGAITGACASFLYNLRAGINDITSGKCRVALVGNSEAPIVPEALEGFNAMGALANEDNLKKLDGTDTPDYRRTSRPFGENCGFTMSESAQFFILMDDALALELGADIHGAVTDVFINADGFKKSISAPGAGNYITVAKAVASAKSIIGSESVTQRSFIQAHGSSTPANRTTESELFDTIAEAFNIDSWPVSAVKSYVGHPLAPASADQLISTLGVFKYGLLPGIKTIDKVADDVSDDRLKISTDDQNLGAGQMDVSFINSKGFGGNNSTATVLAPHIAETMMSKRYGREAMASYFEKREAVRKHAQAYENEALNAQFNTIYNFGQNMIDESLVTVSETGVSLPGFKHDVDLELANPYDDMV